MNDGDRPNCWNLAGVVDQRLGSMCARLVPFRGERDLVPSVGVEAIMRMSMSLIDGRVDRPVPEDTDPVFLKSALVDMDL